MEDLTTEDWERYRDAEPENQYRVRFIGEAVVAEVTAADPYEDIPVEGAAVDPVGQN